MVAMPNPTLHDRFYNARNDPSLVVIEGFHPLKHAFRFGAELLEVVSPDPSALADLQSEYAPDIKTPFKDLAQPVSEELFDRLAPVRPPTGVMAIARRPVVDLAALLSNKAPVPVVLLENPRNLFNIGAAVRASAAAGAAGVVNTGNLDPWKPAALTSGVGLQFAIPVAQSESLPQCDRPLVAVDLGGETLSDFHIPERALLAFGTERQGLSQELLEVADHRVSIPMENGVSSLNLATSVAVILYHWKLAQQP
ncbi:MAG TPA: rRNA methyltransferase [Dehalococcoidia bacterium]|nr:rRNA methyltransferase [SAR202 cluster bacterium]HAA94548.1 rRNA methyltransferase [Dehalococcoidia bacterium]|tara:strand:+ start:585 stop:1343 length:759 start_codon:yes stop_codon:yes gene_type:complete